MSSLLTSPVVDLDTGAVIARPAVIDAAGYLRPDPLPVVLELPMRIVLGGAGALAPLHEALRRSGRHPREAIVLLTGPCGPADRPVLKVTLDGLRNLGYLLGFADVGAESVPLDIIADACPYLLALAPEPIRGLPGDRRPAAVARSVVALARGLGAHALVSGIEREAQLSAVRGWEVRLACGPLLRPGPDGKVRVPLPATDDRPPRYSSGPAYRSSCCPP